VSGDLTQLQNVLLNLGINAAHAMPDGGRITLSTRNTDLGMDYCTRSAFSISPGRYVEIGVSDTGDGIPPEAIDRIFEPFFTTKEKGRGTGLGLAAVYGTVTEHKGEIRVNSEVGVGTTFAVLLPVSVVEDVSDDGDDEMLERGEGTILVVDDEPINRKVAVALLEKLGYKATAVQNGREAIEVYRTQKESIDLVLLDIQMPEMNGQDCYRELQRIDPDVRAVICSGYLRDADIEQLRSDGLKGYIRKPYHGVQFSRTIAGAIRSVGTQGRPT
jgi:CheY-like chemotaxis protein